MPSPDEPVFPTAGVEDGEGGCFLTYATDVAPVHAWPYPGWVITDSISGPGNVSSIISVPPGQLYVGGPGPGLVLNVEYDGSDPLLQDVHGAPLGAFNQALPFP